MTATQHPLIDLVYDDKTGRYIGHLERKLMRLTLNDLKMRALLELLTGEVWDDTDFDKVDNDEIRKIAVDALKEHVGMSHEQARKVVEQRWEAANPPSREAVLKKFAGPTVHERQPAVAPVSRSLQAGAPFDRDKHLRGIAKARARRQGLAEPTSPE